MHGVAEYGDTSADECLADVRWLAWRDEFDGGFGDETGESRSWGDSQSVEDRERARTGCWGIWVECVDAKRLSCTVHIGSEGGYALEE